MVTEIFSASYGCILAISGDSHVERERIIQKCRVNLSLEEFYVEFLSKGM